MPDNSLERPKKRVMSTTSLGFFSQENKKEVPLQNDNPKSARAAGLLKKSESASQFAPVGSVKPRSAALNTDSVGKSQRAAAKH